MNSSADEAERIYNGVAKCLNCDHAGDMACLRTKSMDEIYNCTWTTEVKVEISLGQCIVYTVWTIQYDVFDVGDGYWRQNCIGDNFELLVTVSTDLKCHQYQNSFPQQLSPP